MTAVLAIFIWIRTWGPEAQVSLKKLGARLIESFSMAMGVKGFLIARGLRAIASFVAGTLSKKPISYRAPESNVPSARGRRRGWPQGRHPRSPSSRCG